MLKKLGEALFFVLLFWVAWIFIGSNPTVRMQRVCTAVSGPGHFIASLASAANTDWGGPLQTWTENGTYRCQLTLWNYFYADEWKKAHPGQPLPGDQGGGTYETVPLTGASQAQPAPKPAQPEIPDAPQRQVNTNR
jgi:hypothetical protein